MRTVALITAGLLLTAWLVAAPADACMGCAGVPVYQPAFPVYPWPPPMVYVPPQPYYSPPPAFYFGSGYDPDYRDIRYNRYFQRYQEPPRIRGYTLSR